MSKKTVGDINPIIDYKNTEHIRIHFYIDSMESSEGDFVLLSDDLKIQLNNDIYNIEYQEIEKVEISMCSRLYTPSVIERSLIKVFVKRWKHGLPLTVGQHVKYFLDVNIITKSNAFTFESKVLNNALEIIEYFKNKEVVIIDQIGLENILKTYPNAYTLSRYLDKNFPKLAKKYNLHNPRGVETIK